MEDEILKNRLLYDPKSVKRLYSKFNALVKAEDGAYDALLVEIQLFDYSLTKNEMVQQTSLEEIAQYNKQIADMDQELIAQNEEIQRLQDLLIQAQQNKQNKMDHDVIAKQIVKIPCTKKSNAQIQLIENELSIQREQIKVIENETEQRRKQFYSLVTAIHELQSTIKKNDNHEIMEIDRDEASVDEDIEEGLVEETME